MTRTRSKRRIVIIGAGKIGCAHVAALFAGAGWQITLVARNEATVQRIRAAREYTVRTTDGDSQLIAADAALIGTAAFDEAVAARSSSPTPRAGSSSTPGPWSAPCPRSPTSP
jgi:glutamyl-tRNA reductase